MTSRFIVGTVLSMTGLATLDAAAQRLPPPSRTVYRCEVQGKVTYSDDPCPGARKVDVEPTSGLSKMSGTERIGADVRREQEREMLAGALKPVTGMDAKQFDRYGRRQQLPAQAQKECQALDNEIPRLEAAEARATGEELRTAQAALFTSRQRYRAMRCE